MRVSLRLVVVEINIRQSAKCSVSFTGREGSWCCSAVQAALQSLRRLVGWGEKVLGHSGALKSLSSKTADKDVKRSQTRKKCKPQMMNGF